jgi:hypothetical protein
MARKKHPAIRQFPSGATRNSASGKLDYDGSLSLSVLEAFAEYMRFNAVMPDGSLRPCDDWKRGVPVDEYRKSLWRHHVDAARALQGLSSREGVVFALCGVIFNAQGALHELLAADPGLLERSLAENEARRDAARSGRRRRS